MNRITAHKTLITPVAFCLLFLVALVFPTGALAASLSLSPATANKTVGETFSVDIVLDTEGVAASGMTAILNYDTAKLQVLDDSSAGGVNITSGTNLTQVLTNNVDTSAGQIRYDAGNLGASYNDRGVVATIHFKALAQGAAQVSFAFDPNKTTDTSAVAAAAGPTSLLTTVNDGTYTISTSGSSTTTTTTTTSPTLPDTGAVENSIMLFGGGGFFILLSILFARKVFLF